MVTSYYYRHYDNLDKTVSQKTTTIREMQTCTSYFHSGPQYENEDADHTWLTLN